MKTTNILQSLLSVGTALMLCQCEKPSSSAAAGDSEAAPAVAGQSAVADDVSQKDVVKVAVGSPAHTTLVAAVKAAGLVDVLSNAGPFTVFAPTDDAFAKIDAATIEKLKTDSALLTSILTYHVVSGQADPTQVVGEHTTVQGAQLKVTGSGNDLMVNDAGVVCGGIKTANATLYLIDTVLMPPAAPAATTTTTP